MVEFQFTIGIGFEQHPHNKHMFSIDSVCDTKISGHGVNKKEFLRYITERGWGDGGEVWDLYGFKLINRGRCTLFFCNSEMTLLNTPIVWVVVMNCL